MTTDHNQSDDSSDSVAAAWRENRRAAAAVHSLRLARVQVAESERAIELIAEFLTEVHKLGITPQKLNARSRDAKRVRYRTSLLGWPVRGDGSAAVGQDGKFYYLSVNRSWSARFLGVEPAPVSPPLVLGKGGRDGESVDLKDALASILDQQNT